MIYTTPYDLEGLDRMEVEQTLPANYDLNLMVSSATQPIITTPARYTAGFKGNPDVIIGRPTNVFSALRANGMLNALAEDDKAIESAISTGTDSNAD